MRGFGNALGAFNSFLNELAYKPKGSKQSYLFYLPWLNHNFNATFNLDDPADRFSAGWSCSPATQPNWPTRSLVKSPTSRRFSWVRTFPENRIADDPA